MRSRIQQWRVPLLAAISVVLPATSAAQVPERADCDPVRTLLAEKPVPAVERAAVTCEGWSARSATWSGAERVAVASREANEAKSEEDVLELSRWEITTHLGMHVPIGKLMHADVPAEGGEQWKRQVSAANVGAALAYRLSDLLSLEGGFGYSPGLVAVGENGTVVDKRGHVFMSSARMLLRMEPERVPGDWTFYVAPGFGMINRFGGAWNGTAGTVDPALVLSAGARLHVLDPRLAFTFDLRDYVTRVQFQNGAAGQTEARLHNDFMWSVGVTLPMKW